MFYQQATSAARLMIFYHFLLASSSGWIQTLDLRIISQMFYQFGTAA
jgi:hypothetical protein